MKQWRKAGYRRRKESAAQTQSHCFRRGFQPNAEWQESGRRAKQWRRAGFRRREESAAQTQSHYFRVRRQPQPCQAAGAFSGRFAAVRGLPPFRAAGRGR